MDDEQKKYFNDCVNTYYNLQNLYITAYDKQKKTILKTDGLSWKDKRKLFRNIKQNCVNCKRPVGTIFMNKLDKESGERDLIATCGDKINPCALKIELHMGYTDSIYESIKSYERDLNDLKKTIINDKNNLLFGYITSSNAIKIFDEAKEKLVSTSDMYEYTQNLCLDIKDNPTRNKEIKDLEKKYLTSKTQLKELMANFKLSNYENEQMLRDSIEIYINKIIPIFKNMMSLKFENCIVEYNENDNSYHLVQNTNSVQQIEWYLGESPMRVVSMQTGSSGDISVKKPSKKKTVKPLVLEEEKVEDLEEEIEGMKEMRDEDIFGPDTE
jgi:hypothetical protein